ncbi:MAG TPA: hypothetical protein VFZ63_14835 [Jiangellaceae bacterium]
MFWDLSLQQHVPTDRLARVYSFDAVGSYAMIPIGQLAAGPLAAVAGGGGWRAGQRDCHCSGDHIDPVRAVGAPAPAHGCAATALTMPPVLSGGIPAA